MGGYIAQLIKDINRIVYCCDIAYQVDIHLSTKLPHQGLGVVMHPGIVIGESCTIYQHVTLGQTHGEDGSDGVPVLGNHVMVGAGATVLGLIKIGNNVSIGAHAVVLCDVPDDAVVVGIPAKIKKYKTKMDVVGE